MLLQVLGVIIQAAGLILLHQHWRVRGGLGGGALLGAWVLIILGAAPWLIGVSPERALALGVLAPMLIGLLLLAPDAYARLSGARARSARPRRPARADPGEAAAALSGTGGARWFSALVAAPALCAAAAAAWLAYSPLSAVDSMVFSAFLMAAILTAALLRLLATARPWCEALITCGAALLLAVLAALGAH